MKLKLLFLLLCAQNIVSAHQNKRKFLNKGDGYRNLLERTYVSGYEGAPASDAQCGEPLILTPYIQQNKTCEARRAAYVDSKHFIPGVDSYAGYLTVNKEYNSNLFFWYFPVMKKPVNETPLILWLQGGPGSSSLYGLFEEIGPYTITKDLKIEAKNHSWSKEHSLLFIDNPVGTGFSFTDSDDGYSTNQTAIGENLYKALQQFFTIFPELRKAPFIIAGESYAGKHIPSVAIQILWHKDKDQPINLQGIAIGNGFVDPVTLQGTSYVAREIGLLDDKDADKVREAEKEVVKCINENKLMEAFDYLITAMFELDYRARLQNPYNILSDGVELFGNYVKFVQQPEIRRALHVGNTSYTNIGIVYGKLVPDFMNSAKSWVEELLGHYRVMVYNGHLDTVVAYHPSVNTYNSLSFADADKYKNGKRKVWTINKNVAGYYKKAGNFLEVMVRNAGHMVPVDQPAAAVALITAFARDLPLNNSPFQATQL
ncbi:venom serine carboxypeptidase-like [Maniola hyperantus]|uniref:venom serine carboxypeptidase-like n=1 Tax=Aphantopus hyperantus TaxID=2795564 RepID=UPI001567E180|nr:venom serine carboxypeptidase-like [Maniola hyperantus]